MFLGSWKIDDDIVFYANTHRFDTGAATDADSPPSYRVYEMETSTPILTGSMALLDGSNTAGFYSEQITLSAANGFEKGKSYAIYIQATVNSVIAATHHTLQIEAEVDANRLNWANIDGPTTTVDLSGTTVKTATDIATQITALNNLSAAQVNAEVVDVLRTDTLPDSYAADGVQPTIAQAILAIHQFLTEKSVSGVTVTVNKPSGVAAMTFTLNDATTPSSITRAT